MTSINLNNVTHVEEIDEKWHTIDPQGQVSRRGRTHTATVFFVSGEDITLSGGHADIFLARWNAYLDRQDGEVHSD